MWQVRYVRSGGTTIVEVSIDADASPELQIEFTGSIALESSHFLPYYSRVFVIG